MFEKPPQKLPQDSDLQSNFDRIDNLRKVFNSFEINIPGDDHTEEQKIIFTSDEIDKIISHKGIREHLPETLGSEKYKNNFLQNLQNLNIKPEDWKKCIFQYPQLFYHSAQSINSNIEKTAEMMGIQKEVFIKVALKGPPLFYQSPKTVNSNIENSARLVGSSKKEFLKAALKRPSLFHQSPQTINSNIEKSAVILGLKKEEFLEAAFKQPTLFSQSLETIERNFKALLKIFDNDYNKTKEVILNLPASLTYSSERNFLHFILKKVSGREYSLVINPENELKKIFMKKGNLEGWQKIQEKIDILKRTEQMAKEKEKLARKTKSSYAPEN